MAFRWWADDGPFIAVFVSLIPLSTEKKKKKYVIKLRPRRKNFLDPRIESVHTHNLARAFTAHSHILRVLIKDDAKNEARNLSRRLFIRV